MNSSAALLFSLAIGAVAGLRAMTAPAVVAWAASPGLARSVENESFLHGIEVGVIMFTLAAIGPGRDRRSAVDCEGIVRTLGAALLAE